MPVRSARSRCSGRGLSCSRRCSTRFPMLDMFPAYLASWENPNNAPMGAPPARRIVR
jgi:hypothetical protein